MRSLREWLANRRRENARKVLIREHLHNWSNWSEPEEGHYLYQPVYGMTGSPFYAIGDEHDAESWKGEDGKRLTYVRSEQTRRCHECNLVERRFVE